ncbi:Antithrombin-III [Thelohanellus kitauei]|uniref:Antithrombin-III n=1 Tax=Thelohanellus kitauei TaxID=669202 RepID=A0A0C2IYE2_THEKT|nr:Antithrombin-III [Thelohanellus kitauei]
MPLHNTNIFTTNLLNQLHSLKNANDNIAFSGIGLYFLLGAVHLGVKGYCYNEINRLLEENFDDLYFNNSWYRTPVVKMWVTERKILEESFKLNSALISSCSYNLRWKEMSEYIFNLQHIQIDTKNLSATARKTNAWVSMKTRQSHVDIIHKSILSKWTMILVNTLYVRPAWKLNFNSCQTKKEIFYGDNGQTFEVEMMNQEGYFKLYSNPLDKYRILFKEFTQTGIYSAIVLPREGHKIDDVLKYLEVLVYVIQPESLKTYIDLLEVKFVHLKVPKFKVSTQYDFAELFIKFGIKCIFHETSGTFERMTNDRVFISNLTQVVHLSFEERSFDPGSSTEITVEKSETKPKAFYVTRPFYFFYLFLFHRFRDL